VTYQLHFDIDDNGDYEDPVDCYALITYIPTKTGSKKGWVEVELYRQSGGLVFYDEGRWGEHSPAGKMGGRMCEFYLPMEDLGIFPAQSIRMYLTSEDSEDRVPNSSDIQWSPVPTLGNVGLVMLFAVSLGVITTSLRKRLT
jgi:hypothetical protein